MPRILETAKRVGALPRVHHSAECAYIVHELMGADSRIMVAVFIILLLCEGWAIINEH